MISGQKHRDEQAAAKATEDAANAEFTEKASTGGTGGFGGGLAAIAEREKKRRADLAAKAQKEAVKKASQK